VENLKELERECWLWLRIREHRVSGLQGKLGVPEAMLMDHGTGAAPAWES